MYKKDTHTTKTKQKIITIIERKKKLQILTTTIVTNVSEII